MQSKSNIHQHETMGRRSFTTTMAASAAIGLSAASAQRVLGANSRINVGVIGCGGRAGAHIKTLLNIKEEQKNVEIVAVCDVYRPRMKAAEEQTGGTGTMAHEELLAREDVDLVVLAGPDHWHGYHAIDAMRAGKDVYCEKPLTHWRQVGLPQRMVQTAKETGQIIQVGCQWMGRLCYHKAKELIDDGAIGKPIIAETGYYRVGDWGERGMKIDDPNAKPGPDLDWERYLGDSPRRPFDVSRFFRWRMYWDYAGGPVTDLYPHPLTPVVYMLGLGYPNYVCANGGKHRYEEREVPDTCNMIADYPDRLTIILGGTQANNYDEYASGTRPLIRGWDGTLMFRDNEIVILPTEGSSAKEQHIEVETGERFPQFWAEFLDCCRARKQPASSIELGAVVQTALQMAVFAQRGQSAVHFDHDNERILT